MIKSLYEIFAKTWFHGGQVYVYGDPHFSDLDCYRKRFPKDNIGSYGSKLDYVIAKDRMQIDNINRAVHKNDTLIITGDVGNLECVKSIKAGHKVLIMGNHDTGRSNYERIKKPACKFYFSAFHSKRYMDSEREEIRDLLKQGFYESVYHDATGAEIHELFYDNHLFDEVYEGELTIGPKLKLSHEPLEHSDFCLNIHSHDHSCGQMPGHFNAIAEKLGYVPVSLKSIIESGILKTIPDIHRQTIDRATDRKAKRNKKASKSAPVKNSFEEFQKGI